MSKAAAQKNRSTVSIDPAGKHASVMLRFLIIVILLTGVDLAVKTLSFAHVLPTPVVQNADGQLIVPPHNTVTVIPRVLGLHLTLNEGAVFGVGQGGRWIFVVFTIVAVIAITVMFMRSDRRATFTHIAFAAVLAGALGNMYDRVRFGAVRDMLRAFPDVSLPNQWKWPSGDTDLYPWIFNVADVCLVVGLCVLIILLFQADRAHARAVAQARRA